MKGFRDLVKLNLILSFGVTVVSNVVVAGFIGYWLDGLTVKNNVVFVVFLFIGVLSGIYNGIRQLLKEAERYDGIDKEDGENDGGPGDR